MMALMPLIFSKTMIWTQFAVVVVRSMVRVFFAGKLYIVSAAAGVRFRS